MKYRYIKYLALASVLALGSCSSDYLNTNPTDSTSPETLYKTTENIKMAVNGLAKTMTMQHLGEQGFNGEGTIKMYYGEYSGQNFRVNLPGWANLINGSFYDSVDSIYDYYPWYYYYKLIGNANDILAYIDNAEGPLSEKKYLRAQALSYRAYGYLMLNQLYGNRWVDSNGGTTKSVVLRLSIKDPKDLSTSTLKEVYDQVYKDLDEAITLFKEASYTRPAGKFYYMDESVAHAIYARTAVTRQDYSVAEKEAGLARKNYALMSVSDYKNGFANPNNEWIWGSFGASDEQLHYYSYYSYLAYNSNAGSVRNYPKRMAKELYETIPVSDIRRDLFLNPSGYDVKTYNNETGVAVAKSPLDVDARVKFPALQKDALVAAYMQFKFKANDLPGVGNMNHFRASEMYFIEAEAKHFLGKDGEAAQLLEEVVAKSGRDSKYTCTKTGNALFEEIVKYRGIEFWGEGLDWFDMKRWNRSIVRKLASEGGNYPKELAKTLKPDETAAKWTWKIPNKENDFK